MGNWDKMEARGGVELGKLEELVFQSARKKPFMEELFGVTVLHRKDLLAKKLSKNPPVLLLLLCDLFKKKCFWAGNAGLLYKCGTLTPPLEWEMDVSSWDSSPLKIAVGQRTLWTAVEDRPHPSTQSSPPLTSPLISTQVPLPNLSEEGDNTSAPSARLEVCPSLDPSKFFHRPISPTSSCFSEERLALSHFQESRRSFWMLRGPLKTTGCSLLPIRS